MWISDRWKDYELIDCSRGERLERWGEHILIRPDPQVIWDTPRKHSGWKNPSARYIRSQSGGGHWNITSLPASWEMNYSDLKFCVKPMNFKHTGIFPEQAVNWDYAIHKIRSADRKLNVLNLFAYTGCATIAALSAGASVCHVDAAKGMVAWAKENAVMSGLQGAHVRWIVDDCVKFVQREIRRGRKYDAIIMDPPSYGRGPTGEIWKLEDNLFQFIRLCADVLSDDPEFVIINSYTTGFSPTVIKYICDTILVERFGGKSESRELGLPVSSKGMFLPCGSTCRWESDRR